MSMTRDELLDVIREAGRRNYFGGLGGGGGATPAGGASPVNTLNTSANAASAAMEKLGDVLGVTGAEMYSGFKKISDQSYKVSDATDSISRIFNEMGGPAGRAAGAVIQDLGRYGQETVDKWKDVSKFGASFGNDAIGMRAGAAQTRMSFDEYTEFLRKNKDQLVGLGGSVTESAKSFNQFSKDLLDTTPADTLRHMGLTTTELNDIMVGQMQTQRLVNLQDKDARGVAMRATVDLAEQMDAVAKLTGKSRQEQEDAMKARQTDAQYQAMEKLALMGLNEKDKAVRAATIQSMQTSAHALGPSIEQVVKEMATGGVRSKEASEQMAALGPAGRQLQEAVNASKNAKTEEDKQRAERLMKDAEAAIIAQQNTKGYLEAQRLGIGAFKTGAESTMSYSKSFDAAVVEMNAARKEANKEMLNLANPADVRKVQEFMQERVKLEQQSKDKAGKDIEGAQTTKAMVDFESRAKDAGAAINANLVAPLNEALGRNIRSFGDVLANVKDGKSFRERVETPIGGITRMIVDDPNQAQAAQPAKVRDRETGKERDVPDVVRMNRERDSIMGNIGGMVSKIGTMGVDVINVGKIIPGVSRQMGSLGETGNLFENFGAGTFAMLHGKESVVTEDQMKNLMKGMQGLSMENLANTFKTTVSSAPSMGSMKIDKQAEIERKLEQLSRGFESKTRESSASQPANFEDLGMTGTASIDDLDDKLDKLNSSIMQLVALSAQTLETNGRQLKATKGLGGNLFA